MEKCFKGEEKRKMGESGGKEKEKWRRRWEGVSPGVGAEERRVRRALGEGAGVWCSWAPEKGLQGRLRRVRNGTEERQAGEMTRGEGGMSDWRHLVEMSTGWWGQQSGKRGNRSPRATWGSEGSIQGHRGAGC